MQREEPAMGPRASACVSRAVLEREPNCVEDGALNVRVQGDVSEEEVEGDEDDALVAVAQEEQRRSVVLEEEGQRADGGVDGHHEEQPYDIELLYFVGVPGEMLVDEPERDGAGDDCKQRADRPPDNVRLEDYSRRSRRAAGRPGVPWVRSNGRLRSAGWRWHW